jgi:hypothetical protein
MVSAGVSVLDELVSSDGFDPYAVATAVYSAMARAQSPQAVYSLAE